MKEDLKNIKTDGEEQKLKLSEKISLVFGYFPNTFHTQMIQMYLLFFYTDFMKVNPAFIAGLFLVVRILDAIVAPFFGIVIDKVKLPWGKYTPWFMIIGIPFGISGWLTFTNYHFSPTVNLVYVAVTYVVYSILAGISSIPGSAVVPTVTKRVDERVGVGQFSFLFTILGAVIVQVGAVPIYKTLGGGDDAKGFSLLMAIAGVLTILVAIFQATRIKERYIANSYKDNNSPSLKQMLSATFTNKAAVIVYVFAFSSAISAGIRSAVLIYFYKYFFNNEGLMAVMGFVQLFPSILGVVLSRVVVKRLGLKGTVFASFVANLVLCPILLFIPANSIGLIIFIISNVVSTLFGAMSGPAQGAMLPAAIDYTEWKTGLNLNGFMSSLNGFVQTLATALSGAIAAGALAIIGYMPDVQQSNSTLFGFKILVSVLPGLFSLMQLGIIWYDLTEEKQKMITNELAERRKTSERI